jgi:acyl-homoserine lactone acylase PvdQ
MLCRTVHGPVQARAGRVAYARRYAAWQHEGDSLVGIAALTRSRSLRDVDRAMRRMTWTENVLAADDQGHIGFWHPGNYPLRSRRYDERLPFPGTGGAEWRGLLPRTAMPRVIDPKGGRTWLVNWNNPPSADFTSGDGQAREQLNGPYHRVAMLQALVRAAAGSSPDLERASAGIVRRSAVLATQRTTAGPALQRALAGATGPARDVLATLVAWDGDYDRTAPDGTVDPGVATWRAFKAAAQEQALGKPDVAERGLVGRPGDEGFVEATLGETYALRTLGPAGYRRAAAAAAAALSARFGSGTPASWREPRTMLEAAPLGLVSAPAIPLTNRGSWEQRVELGP